MKNANIVIMGFTVHITQFVFLIRKWNSTTTDWVISKSISRKYVNEWMIDWLIEYENKNVL